MLPLITFAAGSGCCVCAAQIPAVKDAHTSSKIIFPSRFIASPKLEFPISIPLLRKTIRPPPSRVKLFGAFGGSGF
jgi:hypothetical protein